MDFSPQQQAAIAGVSDWLDGRSKGRRKPFYYLAGYAGTGKTTLAKHLAELRNGQVLFAAFTGKAAKVLQEKGCIGASTIHSLIYKPRQDNVTGKFEFSLDRDSACKDAALIIIDECSMVDEKLGADLLSFGTPVLVLGDPFQLPPVRGAGYFTSGEPDFMLDEVHRQAADSPILQLATAIRRQEWNGEPQETPKCRVIGSGDVDRDDVLSAGTLIVGRNITRQKYNRRMRALRGFEGDIPNPGETLICLRNDHQIGCLNGSLWTVERVKRTKRDNVGKIHTLNLEEVNGDSAIEVSVREQFFNGTAGELHWKVNRGLQQFDYGYAITAHKSQGSQWDRVVVFDESRVFGDESDRWLYTAATRAAEELIIVQ